MNVNSYLMHAYASKEERFVQVIIAIHQTKAVINYVYIFQLPELLVKRIMLIRFMLYR